MLTAIIGAGPAGVACAIWLHRLGCPVILLEKNSRAGGLQQQSPYENGWIPSVLGLTGQEVAQRLHDHLMQADVPQRMNAAVQTVHRQRDRFRLDLSDGEVIECSQLVVATGARCRSGGFQPSRTVSIGPGINIDALAVKGKRVAILGGGDNAFDEYVAITKRRGAGYCHIFARTVRGQQVLRDKVPESLVTRGPFVADVERMTVNGQRFDVFCVLFGFEAVIPNGLQDIEQTASGFIKADHWGQTSIPRLYAAGEVAQTFHPCVTTSFAHGIQVAKRIQYLLGL